LLVVLVGTSLTCGCASSLTMRQVSPVIGTPHEFESGFDDTREAARCALLSLGLGTVDEYTPGESMWAIVGSSGLSPTSYGELVRVVVEEVGESRCIARVYAKPKLATNILAKTDYSIEVFAAMMRCLESE
jgi:hypothetical protein